MREQRARSTRSSSTEAIAGMAAIGSILAASGCCLPVLPFVAAAGFGGGSAFLSASRPYLLGASVFFIAFGFYQARRAKKCHRRRSVLGPIVLWASTVFVAISIFFPQMLANATANLVTP